MHFTDDVVAPLTAERGHNLRALRGTAELIPELMMGRSRAGHLNFASLGISLPPNFLIASRSRRKGGELEEKTGGIDDGWREIPVRRAWSDGRDGDYLDGFHTFPGMCTKFDGLRPSSKRVLLSLLLWSLDRVPGSGPHE